MRSFIEALNHLKGWTLYEADFKKQAAGKADTGTVLLTRSPKQATLWYALPAREQERYPLFVSASGHTLPEAIINAALAACELPAVPALEH